ncbi:MAG: hypothetical protein QW334_00345 [Thermofilum sp.]
MIFIVLALIWHLLFILGWTWTGTPFWGLILAEDVFLWLALIEEIRRLRKMNTHAAITNPIHIVPPLKTSLETRPEVFNCGSCGRQVTFEMNFCPDCGSYLYPPERFAGKKNVEKRRSRAQPKRVKKRSARRRRGVKK